MKAMLLAVSLLAAAAPLAAAPLALDAYLDQVRLGNQQLHADRARDAALDLQAKDPLTAFSPMLSGQVSRLDDRSEAMAPELSPIRTQSTAWGLGLSKFFTTGTYASLSYTSDRTALDFTPGGFLGGVDNMGHQLNLTVAQPLWRNFMAAEVQAGVDLARSQSDADRAGNRYQAQALLLQARQAYVQLCTVRQVTSIQQESLERNQKILEWTQHKYADNLADKVDVLQVQAALRQVSLGLAQSRLQEAKARAQFNALRGASPTADVEDLAPLAVPASLPQPQPGRQDLVAAQAFLRTTAAVEQGVVQRFTPDISLFASLSVNDRDTDGGQAAADLAQAYHPTSVVGVKLTANLDEPLYRQALEGARKAKGGGEMLVADKQREIAKDWTQLQDDWQSTLEQLALAKELEGLQKEKAEREKVRYQDGRTTDFQVLRFEDDYNLSRVQTLQLTAAAVSLEAQARYYNAEDQPW